MHRGGVGHGHSMTSGLVSSIIPEDPSTWRDKVFITIDIEWASDETILHVLEPIRSAGLFATLFWTHPTPLIESIRADRSFELGIHPNFNRLLEGGSVPAPGGAEAILRSCMDIVPEARAVRSHCVTDGSRLTGYFRAAGLRHVCNAFLPVVENMANRPWRSIPDDMITVPSCWADDVHCAKGWTISPAELLQFPGLKVFNFHPVTVALNISDLSHYNAAKPHYHDFDYLRANRNTSRGVGDFLQELVHEIV